MARLMYLVTILLTISLVFAEDQDTADADTSPSDTEGKAGEAIKSLLQEKITQKFKEAANEVKGVLVKQLGDSLKSAHDVFKQRDKAKVNAANTAKVQGKQSAAAVHQNKANRHRKNSGPQAGKVVTQQGPTDPDTLPPKTKLQPELLQPNGTPPSQPPSMPPKAQATNIIAPQPPLASPPPPRPPLNCAIPPCAPPLPTPQPPPPPFLTPPSSQPPHMGLLLCPATCRTTCGPTCLLRCCRHNVNHRREKDIEN